MTALAAAAEATDLWVFTFRSFEIFLPSPDSFYWMCVVAEQ